MPEPAVASLLDGTASFGRSKGAITDYFVTCALAVLEAPPTTPSNAELDAMSPADRSRVLRREFEAGELERVVAGAPRRVSE